MYSKFDEVLVDFICLECGKTFTAGAEQIVIECPVCGSSDVESIFD